MERIDYKDLDLPSKGVLSILEHVEDEGTMMTLATLNQPLYRYLIMDGDSILWVKLLRRMFNIEVRDKKCTFKETFFKRMLRNLDVSCAEILKGEKSDSEENNNNNNNNEAKKKSEGQVVKVIGIGEYFKRVKVVGSGNENGEANSETVYNMVKIKRNYDYKLINEEFELMLKGKEDNEDNEDKKCENNDKKCENADEDDGDIYKMAIDDEDGAEEKQDDDVFYKMIKINSTEIKGADGDKAKEKAHNDDYYRLVKMKMSDDTQKVIRMLENKDSRVIVEDYLRKRVVNKTTTTTTTLSTRLKNSIPIYFRRLQGPCRRSRTSTR